MTLREGVYSNRQSSVIWGEGSFYGEYGGRRLVENVIWGGEVS